MVQAPLITGGPQPRLKAISTFYHNATLLLFLNPELGLYELQELSTETLTIHNAHEHFKGSEESSSKQI